MAKSVAVHVQTFFVSANGIKIDNINIANKVKANVRLHSGLKITKLAWSTRAIREKKIYSILYIEVATAAMANQLTGYRHSGLLALQ